MKIYNLIGVTKLNEPEKFDRSGIVGKTFSVAMRPEVGKSFFGVCDKDAMTLKTTAVNSIVEDEDRLTVSTRNTVYTFKEMPY